MITGESFLFRARINIQHKAKGHYKKLDWFTFLEITRQVASKNQKVRVPGTSMISVQTEYMKNTAKATGAVINYH